MSFIVRNGDLIAVAAGGVFLGVADVTGHVDPVWWIVWGGLSALTLVMRGIRMRMERRGRS
ncbi:hypothetical protein ACIGFK_07410 [Streptomyces sp. NPDC085524]|uniref:hypothetical protein n=1 Tax=unclassified Streptomyces TaxID=2593676 RepID=UPI0035D68F8C